MSTLLYFDCFSGISGDMVLGALLDAGLPLDELKGALGSLAVSGYDVDATKVLRSGISATKFVVRQAGAARDDSDQQTHVHDAPHAHDHSHSHDHVHSQAETHSHGHTPPHSHEHSDDADLYDPEATRLLTRSALAQPAGSREHAQHRTLAAISASIDRSALSAEGRERAKAMFGRLAEAEASIHHMPVDQVHLHEVGALDSIIDIVGAVFALEWFGAERIVCSPLNVGGGTVKAAHGLLPVPAPATVALLHGAPIYSGRVQQELVTPTGALIATTYASSFGAIPAMTIERVGYGAGDRDVPDNPNVLRVLVGRAAHDPQVDRVTVIECEIDDMNPQIFGVVMDRLYAAGALEVFHAPVQMKKNRPGTVLTVIAPPDLRARLADVIFRETTTIGLRYGDVDRECLKREIVTVATPIGAVRFKIAWRDGRVINVAPEFEDMARLAAEHGLSVKDVQAVAVRAYGEAPAAERLGGS